MCVAGVREVAFRNSPGRPVGYRNVANSMKTIVKPELAYET